MGAKQAKKKVVSGFEASASNNDITNKENDFQDDRDSLISELEAKIKNLTDLVEKLTSTKEEVKNEKEVAPTGPGKEDVGVTIASRARTRAFTVKKSDVIKVYRGVKVVNHPRLNANLILGPGCVVKVTSKCAKLLLSYPDFEKYGLENL